MSPIENKLKEILTQSWQQVHARIEEKTEQATSASYGLGFAVYYYLLGKTLNDEQHLQRAERLFDQFLAGQPPGNAGAETENLADIAWLHACLNGGGGDPARDAWLAALDEYLFNQAVGLLQYYRSPGLLKILHYFTLRLPGAGAGDRLRDLLLRKYQPTGGHYLPSWYKNNLSQPGPPQTLRLGLCNGLATELLLLIKIYQSGIRDERIKEDVRQGILYLLSFKREVDFSSHRYTVFPDQVDVRHHEAIFINQLRWDCGDMGAALLLYKAHELLDAAELKKIAELTALNTLLIRGENAAPGGPAFYRGATGVAYLYHLLYRSDPNEAFRKGHAFWLEQTCRALSAAVAADSYLNTDLDRPDVLVKVGIVLALALAGQDFGWGDNFITYGPPA